MIETNLLQEGIATSLGRPAKHQNLLAIAGSFRIECRDHLGNRKWIEEFDNAVVEAGKKYLLDALNTSLSAVGPYLGLISGTPTAAQTDTMGAHPGWTEWASVAARGTPTWTAASATGGTATKTHSGSVSFAVTGSGTVGGCFIVLGTGAVTTIGNTGGILYSVGSFTGKTVASGDTLNVTYSTTLS